MKGNPVTDPKGLIFEAYRIEGITEAECRTIFLDWALSLPDSSDTAWAIAALLDEYEAAQRDHPMNAVLHAGKVQMAAPPRRRGGWRSRPRN